MTVTKVGGANMIAHAQWPLCPPFPRVAVFYVTPAHPICALARRISTKGPVSPLNASYHKVSTLAPSLFDCSGYLPLPGHVIGVSRRRNCRHKGGTGEAAAHAVLVPKKHSLQSDMFESVQVYTFFYFIKRWFYWRFWCDFSWKSGTMQELRLCMYVSFY